MDDSQRKQALALAWDLIQKQHQVLRELVATNQDMGACLIANRQPTAQQVTAWIAQSKQLTGRLEELTSTLQSVQSIVQPLFPTDS